MIIVSACLAGRRCRYDGKATPDENIIRLVKEGKAVPVCPEQLGNLPTPREPSEQKGDKVITRSGKDVTEEFHEGAKKALQIAKDNNCKKAILKERSPSCGYRKVYDGTFTGNLIQGNGVFADMLEKEGLKILDY